VQRKTASCEGTPCDDRYSTKIWIYQRAIILLVGIIGTVVAAVVWKTNIDNEVNSIQSNYRTVNTEISELKVNIRLLPVVNSKLDTLIERNRK
jgi:hypothetical protein